MKTIGLVGGMSWESSAEYYRIINQAIQEKQGGVHSAKIALYSFDFQERISAAVYGHIAGCSLREDGDATH